MRGARFISRALAPVIATAMVAATPQASAQTPQASYKAAIVYNIIRFASFDSTASPQAIRLCAFAQDPMADALAQLDAKPVGDRTLNVRLVGTGSDLGNCDIAYIGSDGLARRNLPRRLLTIGDAPGFANSGGVGLIRIGRQIRFEINVASARDAGVVFSSKLLRLAVDVRGTE